MLGTTYERETKGASLGSSHPCCFSLCSSYCSTNYWELVMNQKQIDRKVEEFHREQIKQYYYKVFMDACMHKQYLQFFNPASFFKGVK